MYFAYRKMHSIQMSMRSSFLGLDHILLIGLIIAPFSAICTLVVLYSTNSLFLKDEWVVQKRMMQFNVMGSSEFLLTRMPVAQNQLNLGSYFGFQEVLLRKWVNPTEIDFDFEITNGSYLDITFNRDKDSFLGIRFSRNGDIQSQQFASDIKGQFIHHRPLLGLPTLNGWLRARISETHRGLSIIIDDQDPILLESIEFHKGAMGFRGGYAGARIKNIKMMERDGTWVAADFSNTKGWLTLFGLNLLVIGFMGGVLIAVPGRVLRRTPTQQIMAWMGFSGVGLICFSLWYAFDYFYYSSLVYQQNGITQRLNGHDSPQGFSFEELRYAFFKSWYGWVIDTEISQQKLIDHGYTEGILYRGPIYCGPHREDCQVTELGANAGSHVQGRNYGYRIIFLGTSQTIGVGAHRIEDTFFSLIHWQLRGRLNNNIELESVNLSVAGSNSIELLPSYRDKYIQLKPDLVVINLSTNDFINRFEKGLGELLTLNQSVGAQTILLEEAAMVSPEAWFKGANEANHKILRKLAKEFDCPTYPLHKLLNGPNLWNTGTLWWDPWHLTSYGHKLVADSLGPVLYEMLLKLKPRHRPMVKINAGLNQ